MSHSRLGKTSKLRVLQFTLGSGKLRGTLSLLSDILVTSRQTDETNNKIIAALHIWDILIWIYFE